MPNKHTIEVIQGGGLKGWTRGKSHLITRLIYAKGYRDFPRLGKSISGGDATQDSSVANEDASDDSRTLEKISLQKDRGREGKSL